MLITKTHQNFLIYVYMVNSSANSLRIIDQLSTDTVVSSIWQEYLPGTLWCNQMIWFTTTHIRNAIHRLLCHKRRCDSQYGCPYSSLLAFISIHRSCGANHPEYTEPH